MLNKYFEAFELLNILYQHVHKTKQGMSINAMPGYSITSVWTADWTAIMLYKDFSYVPVLGISTDLSTSSRGGNRLDGYGWSFTNIKAVDKIDLHDYDTELELSPEINLSTGEGEELIFQVQTVYSDIITSMFALGSHYKNMNVDNIGGITLWCGDVDWDELIINLKKCTGVYYD